MKSETMKKKQQNLWDFFFNLKRGWEKIFSINMIREKLSIISTYFEIVIYKQLINKN